MHDVVTALLGAGLKLEIFREYPYSNGCKFFDRMRPAPGLRWLMPEGVPDLPLMFSVVTSKV